MKNANYVGRAYLRVRYTKDEGMHKPVGNSQSSRRVLSHLRYIGFRSRELDQDSNTYGFFDELHDKANMKPFYNRIYNDPALKHPNTIKLHKLIIGFHRDWYDRYEIDYKALTRYIMERLEVRKGFRLDWIAAEHLKETSPHVHVAIKSTGKDELGYTKRLIITREDIEWMKDAIDRYTGREQFLERDHEMERSISLAPDLLQDLTKEIERQSKQGQRDSERARRKAERENKNRQRNERDR